MTADFDLTRTEAAAGVHTGLPNFAYHTVLGSWKHETGAWMCIEHVRGFPNVYIVMWRAVPNWGGGTIENLAAFEEPDEKIAWTRALHCAKTAFENGPRGAVLAKALETSAHHSEIQSQRGTKGGKQSGITRSENAEDFAKAREQAKKFYGKDTIPKYKPALWRFEPVTDRSYAVFTLAYLKQPGVYIVAENEPGKGGWRVERDYYPDGNDDSGRIEETVKQYLSYEEACDVMSKLADSDPFKWLKSNFALFV